MREKILPQNPWTTNDELKYIEHLQDEQVNGYFQGCRKRVNWGEMEVCRILQASVQRLHDMKEAK